MKGLFFIREEMACGLEEKYLLDLGKQRINIYHKKRTQSTVEEENQKHKAAGSSMLKSILS